MTDLLAIGASGVRAYRAALGAVGDNIANAQTDGYARRGVRLSEISVTRGINPLYRNQTAFSGVDIAATTRASDAWRSADARLAGAASARAGAASSWMQVAEAALDDGDNGVGASLGRMFANGDALAADPSGRATRAAFLAGVDDAARAIRTSAGDLARAADGVADSARQAVDGVNANLSALADINLAIRHAAPGSTAFASLSDQRDRLIDGVAAATGASATIAPDGSATLAVAGQVLLSGNTAAVLALGVAGDGRLSFSTGAGALIPTSGALAGLGEASGTIADRRASLDGLANDLSAALNSWHTQGSPGGAALLSTGGALTLTALIGDPDALSAASAAAPNGNALALADVRSGSGVEVSWANLAAAQAQATASARTRETIADARRDTADAARDAVEGVDLDREAADLLRFQQAYEGAARVVQAGKETLDTILRLFG